MNNFLRLVLPFCCFTFFSVFLFSQTAGCDAVTVSSANGAIDIAGLTNTNVVQVFNNDWSASVYNQTLDTTTASIPNLNVGQNYHVKFQQYNTKNGPWQFLCEKIIDVIVLGTVVTNSCRYQDSLGLVVLYKSTNSDSTKGFKWDFTKPMTTWHGITLNANGCVEKMIFDDNLTGTLPSNFSFSEVDTIDFSGSSIQGPIPNNFVAPKLKYLNFYLQAFKGPIPNFNLPSLEFLEIFGTSVTGSIPNFNLPNLKELQIYNDTYLTGPIPNFNLPNLQKLRISNTGVSGAIPNFNLPNLTNLALTQDSISGTIPNFSLPKLTDLEIYGSQIEGNIPNFNLPNLTTLLIVESKLAGSIPNFNLPNLTNLSIGGNQLIGSIPNFNLPNLTFLNFGSPLITGSIPNFNLPNLKTLHMGGDKLTGSIPNFNLPNLTDFTLTGKQLTGSIPNFNLPNLTFLNIQYTQLTGFIPNFNFPKISYLNLNNNQLTGCIPANFKTYCGKTVSFTGNPNLLNQDFTTYCSSNTGACATTNPCDTDTVPPVFLNCPQNINLTTASTTATATWTAPTATDNCTTPTIAGNFNSGTAFPVGSTTIIYSAIDAKLNKATCSFNITVANINTNSCRQQDSLNLVILYKSTNGDSTWGIKWDFTKPMTTWHGITLNANGCVEKMIFDDNLTGTLPANFSFSEVDTIDFSSSSIQGPIPSNFIAPKLKYLNFFLQAFKGPIPNFNLPSLEFLQITGTQVNGPIPNFNLPNLKELRFFNNPYLTGPIPNFNLPNLQKLTISSTSVNGTIPNFNLPNLIDIAFRDDSLSGNIPNFTNLPKLSNLDFAYNKLNGIVPNFNLPNLTVLNLLSNQLTGSIPNFNLPNLTGISISSNQLTGLIPNFNLPNLTFLSFGNNQLMGLIPNFNLPNLTLIYLDNNQLTGCIPANFKTYCGKSVTFSGNPGLLVQDFTTYCSSNTGACATTNPCDTDTVPPVFLNCPQNINLTTASTTATATWTTPTATDNCTTPTIAGNFNSGTAFPVGTTTIIYSAIDAKLNKAVCSFNIVVTQQIVMVGGCDAVVATSSGGAINLSGLTNTTVVQVFNNTYSANVLTQTVNTNTFSIPNLIAGQNYHVKIQQYDTKNGPWKFICEKTIDVTVSGVVVSNSCRQQDSLTLVSLYNSAGGVNWTKKWDLSKPVTSWYGLKFTSDSCVSEIDLSLNNLVGTIPANFSLTALTSLIMQGNQLSGGIPNFNMPNLVKLILYSNSLSGTIPNFNLPNLQLLQLEANKLTGSIPNFNLPNLTLLHLSGNLFGGTIPNFNLPNLQLLEIASCQLTGTIPNFNFPNLIEFYVPYNQLTGSIPNFIFPKVHQISLENNNLSGCIPASIKLFCDSASVNLSNNPNLSSQDYYAFCRNNTGACTTISNDLAVSITVTPTSYKQFTNQSFRISVTNTGSTAFTNAQIVLTVPDKLAGGASATLSSGIWNSYCAGGVKCNTWAIPSVAANSTATMDISYFVTDATAPLTVIAALTASTPTDLNTSNNTASVTINPPTSGKLAASGQIQFVPIVLEKLAPNPTDGEVSLQLQSIVDKNIMFIFSDAFGRQVVSEKRPIEKGINNVTFDLSALPQGIYFLQIDANELRQAPVKIVKF